MNVLTRAWLAKGLTKAGVPYVGQVDKLITASKLLDPVAILLGEITGIQSLNGASWLKPPTVRIFLQRGSQFDVGILTGPRKLNKDPRNDQAMQDFMGRLQSSVPASGAV